MTREDILNVIRANRSLIEEKFSVKNIGLFGSYAKGTATQESDIDFYVVFRKKTLDNMTGLWIFLEEAFGKKVDMLHSHPGLREGLKTQIEREVIYA